MKVIDYNKAFFIKEGQLNVLLLWRKIIGQNRKYGDIIEFDEVQFIETDDYVDDYYNYFKQKFMQTVIYPYFE